jgi:O-antigen/teichoic acid export membrane protein
MQRASRFFWNGIALLLGRSANLVPNLLIAIWVSRHLGVEAFGSYSAALGLLATFRLVAALGFENLLPRQVGQNPSLTGKYHIHSLLIATVSAACLTVAMSASALLFSYTDETVYAVRVASLALLPLSLTGVYESLFVGHERAGYVAATNLLEVVGRLICSWMVLVQYRSVSAVISVYVLFRWVTATLEAGLFVARVDRPKLHMEWDFIKGLSKELFEFSAITIMAGLFWNIGLVMLSILANEHEIGIYNAAYKIVFVWSIVPTSLMAAVFPSMSRLCQVDQMEFQRLTFNALRYLGSLAFPLAVGGAVLANDLIMVLYKTEFQSSVLALQILIWALVPLFTNNVLYRILLASHRQRATLRVTAVSLGTNLLLCGILIPVLGAWGAALGGFLATCVELVQYSWLTRCQLPVRAVLLSLGKFALAGASMGVLMLLLRQSIGWVGTALLGVGLYIGISILLRALTGEDMRVLWRLLVRTIPSPAEHSLQ